VTQFVVAAIFGRAYCRAASIGNAANGFARAVVRPVDRTVFQDHDFSASTALQDDSGTSPVEKNLFQSWESKYKGRLQSSYLCGLYLSFTEGCFNGKDLEDISGDTKSYRSNQRPL
jgi:hypothetical protein